MVIGVSIAGLVYWGLSKVGEGLRTLPLGGTRETLVGALSARVLNPSINGNAMFGQEALLDQFKKNPTLVHQRYVLVVTWINAGKIFKAVSNSLPSEETVVNSATITNVLPEDRVDGWGNPYCLFSNSERVTFLSSWGKGVLKCESLRDAAEQAGVRANDSRLNKQGDLLGVLNRFWDEQ